MLVPGEPERSVVGAIGIALLALLDLSRAEHGGAMIRPMRSTRITSRVLTAVQYHRPFGFHIRRPFEPGNTDWLTVASNVSRGC